ncbi:MULTISPECIES: hypothetical protein [Providencia]|uniref:phage tail fiber protein n=1 Tax=Providencia TaxID=586 RepID=UPI00141A36F2|nr:MULTISPECIES: hypothetical protein [Providencia]ELR5146820.1 hypothetical protein [Providencia rettgeri]NIA43715.1 hypothetical protein [Providencia rettgeri]NIA97544.1 hypothetical protein [Providencia rettgeri]NIB15343.1 hypothetical protein [Providencia rettgeri]NIB35555.1 hypothetical protein [Providencia rettgeri]
MYNIGTVTTTANSTKVTGTNTKWKDNNSRVSAEQIILIVNGTTAYINSIQSIQSDTELTLSFPAPVAVKNGTYNIHTTMVNSVSDAANKIVAMNVANVQFSDIVNRLATETGVIEVVLPDGTKKSMKTFAEMEKQLDGKFDKAGGTVTGPLNADGAIQSKSGVITSHMDGRTGVQLDGRGDIAKLRGRNKDGTWFDHIIPESAGTLAQIGDFGLGIKTGVTLAQNGVVISDYRINGPAYCYGGATSDSYNKGNHTLFNIFAHTTGNYGAQFGFAIGGKSDFGFRMIDNNAVLGWCTIYHTRNTTKDSNGNLKAASPIVKLFADDIELNEESEGVEMEHLGIGHYLIKGVVGFNADGAWGINNGFVIPQDHNGKNMVLIDYEVRPDGDIEIFVFHQQNADMPERFQNKRIKHFDEEGVPVYFENYEPCDVPESRWIDMRVEMPPNSLYNQKQAEAERLAKLEAERLAQEEAKRAAEEAERVD